MNKKRFYLLFLTFYSLCFTALSQEIDTSNYRVFTHYDDLTQFAFSFKTKWLKKGYQSYKLNEKFILRLELIEESKKYEVLLSKLKYWHLCLNKNPYKNSNYTELNRIIKVKLNPENFPNPNDDIKSTISKYNNAIDQFKYIVKEYISKVNSFYNANKSRLDDFGPYAFLPEVLAEIENTDREYLLIDFINFLDAEFKPYEMNGVYLDISTRTHIARQAVIKGIVFKINAGNSGNTRAYNWAKEHSDEINQALKQKNIWFLNISEYELPAYLMMRELFNNMYTKANASTIKHEETEAFYITHPSMFRRSECRLIEVLAVHKIAQNERPHEVIRRFRQSGINAILPNYRLNSQLPFETFTLGEEAYPLNITISTIAENIRDRKKWSTSYGETFDKSEQYYLRVDEVFPEIDKDLNSAKEEIIKYLAYIRMQNAFMKQLGINLLF